MSKNKMKIFGHRGAAGVKLENTIESFTYAIDVKVDYIELDVWDTLDKEIIVFHDAYLDRLTPKQGKTSDHSLADIKQIILSNKEHIPTLNEVIAVISKSNIPILVEVKSESAIPRTFEILKSKLDNSKYIIGSFYHENIMKIKIDDPAVQTAIMFEGVPVDFENYLEKINPDFVVTAIDTFNKPFIKSIKKQHRKLVFYTVNTPADLNLAIETDPFGIVTNFPDTIFSIE